MERIRVCRYPHPCAGIIRIRFQGSRQSASSQPMVCGSPSVCQIVVITLVLQCQKVIRFNYWFFAQKSAVILPQQSNINSRLLNA